MDITLCVLAAGMGSRFGGLKQITPVGPSGEVVLDYSVYDALKSGFTKVVFVIQPGMEQDFRSLICPRFAEKIAIDFAYQTLEDLPVGFSVPDGRSKPWGTGHAVFAARKKIQTPFLTINADDFYGRVAFETMATFLQGLEKKATSLPEFALLGYKLSQTLSQYGTVSRGICRGSFDGRLKGIVEMTKIAEVDGILANREEGNPDVLLSGDEQVSMNFWGFTPAFFSLLEQRFQAFLAMNGSDSKAEFYLPSAVTDLIASGEATARLLSGGGKWFGITYPNDKEEVGLAIHSLVDRGKYPKNLWA